MKKIILTFAALSLSAVVFADQASDWNYKNTGPMRAARGNYNTWDGECAYQTKKLKEMPKDGVSQNLPAVDGFGHASPLGRPASRLEQQKFSCDKREAAQARLESVCQNAYNTMPPKADAGELKGDCDGFYLTIAQQIKKALKDAAKKKLNEEKDKAVAAASDAAQQQWDAVKGQFHQLVDLQVACDKAAAKAETASGDQKAALVESRDKVCGDNAQAQLQLKTDCIAGLGVAGSVVKSTSGGLSSEDFQSIVKLCAKVP